MMVEEINYTLDWTRFRKGQSIFIPCLKCVRAREVIAAKAAEIGVRILAKIVITDDVRGLRIWRI